LASKKFINHNPENCCVQRKGQFYMLDAFFAAAILFVGIGFVIAGYVEVPEQRQAHVTSLDLSQLLFATPLGERDMQYVRDNRALIDETLTPVQQAQVWIHQANNEGCGWCVEEAQTMIAALTGEIVPVGFGTNVTLVDDTDAVTLLYSRLATQRSEPVLLIAKKHVSSVLWDDRVLNPYVMEVRIWR
jgi:hypothetical protein